MRIVIHKSYEALSKWTANYIARRISEHSLAADEPFVLGLPTGSSPIGTYQNLVNLNKRGQDIV